MTGTHDDEFMATVRRVAHDVNVDWAGNAFASCDEPAPVSLTNALIRMSAQCARLGVNNHSRDLAHVDNEYALMTLFDDVMHYARGIVKATGELEHVTPKPLRTVGDAVAMCAMALNELERHHHTLQDLSHGVNGLFVLKRMRAVAQLLEQASEIGTGLLHDRIHEGKKEERTS